MDECLSLQAMTENDLIERPNMSESDHSYLKARAMRYRRVAGELRDKAVSDELNEIAESFDAEAKAVRSTAKTPSPSK